VTYYTGWKLPADQRKSLLQLIPAVYPHVIAHHVTLQYDVEEDTELPDATFGEVVGVCDDGNGLQAIVLKINGSLRRPDGAVYHCTWSLDRSKGRKPVESNYAIEKFGWTKLPQYVAVKLEPKLFGTKTLADS
jgi:hypothetical protein